MDSKLSSLTSLASVTFESDLASRRPTIQQSMCEVRKEKEDSKLRTQFHSKTILYLITRSHMEMNLSFRTFSTLKIAT